MSTFGNITAKSKRFLVAAFVSSTVAGFVGCAGGTYNNCPGYPGYPYNAQPGQYPPTLPYTVQPQQGNVLPQNNVLPQGTLSPQVNAINPANNVAGSTGLPYGYPIGTDPTRLPTQLVPQAPGVLPSNVAPYQQPAAYTASNPYPNTDASTRPLIGWR